MRNTPLGLEDDYVRISRDFTLRRFVPSQSKRFAGHLKQARDLPDSWKNNGGNTVSEVRNDVQYYVNWLCAPDMEEQIRNPQNPTNEKYSVIEIENFAVIHDGIWMGSLYHRHFGDREKERQLGNLGIELFESFRSQ